MFADYKYCPMFADYKCCPTLDDYKRYPKFLCLLSASVW